MKHAKHLEQLEDKLKKMKANVSELEDTILMQQLNKKIEQAVYGLTKEKFCKILSEAKFSFVQCSEPDRAEIAIVTYGLSALQKVFKLCARKLPKENEITDENALNHLRTILADESHGSNIYSFRYALLARFLELPKIVRRNHTIRDARAYEYVSKFQEITKLIFDKIDEKKSAENNLASPRITAARF